MKKALVLIAVAAVIFSSGCLEGIWPQGETVITGKGVIVNMFEPDFPELEPDDKFDLYLEVENIGGTDAKNTYAHLFNIDVSEWGNPTKTKSIGTLESPDEVAGIPGDIGEATWELEAPTVPEGVVFKYQPKVRLMYDYQTIASATIPLMEKSEYKRLKERDMLSVPPITTDVSKGPLAVTISARTPIVIDNYTEDTVEFRVNVDLLQKGGVFDPDHSSGDMNLTSDDMDKLKIKIDASGVEGEAETGSCNASVNAVKEDLRRGKTLIYTCELEAKEFSASASVPVTVILDYGYYEDLTTDIKVTARD
ncbi:MAG: hypothetical protein JSV92_03220 [archaeon]|nr:MAG: hypothetical protein JSV92_03220 [archaeon]